MTWTKQDRYFPSALSIARVISGDSGSDADLNRARI